MGKFDEYLSRAKELVEDVRAGNEISQGIKELENLPEFDGSILYKMELESTINDLNGLLLIIDDKRLDDNSVREEIRKVIDKVQPSDDSNGEDADVLKTDEEQAIERVKLIAYRACAKTLEALEVN